VDCQKSCDFCDNPQKVEQSIRASAATKFVKTQQKRDNRNGKKGAKNDSPWDGQWNEPHGDYDEDAIADDWGDDYMMVGDLRVTGPLEADPGEPTSGSKSFGTKMGFRKASDILSKYEAMEGRAKRNGFDFFGADKQTSSTKQCSVNIPAHIAASLNAASSKINIPQKKVVKATSSEEHANKAKEIQEKLDRMKAECEERRKALQAKTSKKPPPPPPAPLSFGRKK
jgi:hypothetical protein